MEAIELIAEIGVNHGGDKRLGLEMIEAAKESGADTVKFQVFKASELATVSASRSEYQIRNTQTQDTQLKMLSDLELQTEVILEFKEHCKRLNIGFLVSAFDNKSLRFCYQDLGQNRLKIPSGEITNIPFLIKSGEVFSNFILSTGMSNLSDVEMAMAALCFGMSHKGDENLARHGESALWEAYEDDVLRQKTIDKVTLLQCTSEYPAPACDANLLAIQTLKMAFGCKVGFSDHSEGAHLAVASVALGARLIEKHFTLDKGLKGPDHKASSTPEEFKNLRLCLDETSVALGHGQKRASNSEIGTKTVARKVIVAGKPIKEGEQFSSENLQIKRASGSTKPMEYYRLIGLRSTQDYDVDEPI